MPRMMNIGVVAALILCGATAARADPPALFDARVEQIMTEVGVPGMAVAIVEDGVALTRGYGVRRLDTDERVDADTLFQIGSIGKAFTAAALAVLVDRGRIAWDDPVTEHIPYFQMFDPWVTREMTVRDLLVHRSGLGLGAGDLLYIPRTLRSRADIVRALRHIAPATSFRSGYAYDNVLYVVAGQLVEEVTGATWERFMRDEVLVPAGLRTATADRADRRSTDNRAWPHGRRDGPVFGMGTQTTLDDSGSAEFDPDISGAASPAGGIAASAQDMARWIAIQLGHGALPDGAGRLWLGTNRGLARFDPESESFRVFGRRDGVVNVEFNRKARLRASDGTFYFGGLDGVTVFRPEEIVDNPFVPPVALTAVEVLSSAGTREVPAIGLERLELSYREDTLAFEFAALSFAQPEGNRYRYRLEGLDEHWVEAGDRRFARYVHMPPGRYAFRVQAMSHDGVWNREGVTLPIVILPPFWETLWFRLLVVVAVAAAVYGLYRYRLARILAVERLRMRIAGDLHDQLSSDLSGIALASDMVSRRSALDEGDRSRLQVARDTALSSVEALRDIVWYVNPQQDSLEALGARMRSTAQRLLPGHDVEIHAALSDGALPMELRRQIFLTYKELLHNVARHADASRVEVRLERRERSVVLSVADDGVGFDPSLTTSRTGTGLASARARAARMNGTLEVESRLGEGTRVTLRATLPRTRGSGKRRRGLA